MSARSRGFTLAETIVLIVVVGVALAGVLLVFQNTVRGSADPQVRKQAIAIAEALLDEILLAPYDGIAGGATRADFNDVGDYDGYTTGAGGMRDIEGNLIPGLGNYNASVVVGPETSLSDDGTVPPQLAANRARRVTVTVTVAGLADFNITLEGWRVGYAP
jgi:MSHA pilin protein MshD